MVHNLVLYSEFSELMLINADEMIPVDVHLIFEASFATLAVFLI